MYMFDKEERKEPRKSLCLTCSHHNPDRHESDYYLHLKLLIPPTSLICISSAQLTYACRSYVCCCNLQTAFKDFGGTERGTHKLCQYCTSLGDLVSKNCAKFVLSLRAVQVKKNCDGLVVYLVSAGYIFNSVTHRREFGNFEVLPLHQDSFRVCRGMCCFPNW